MPRWDWGMTANSRANTLSDRVPSPLWHIINLISDQIALFSVSIEPCVSISRSIWTTCWLLNWSAQASHRIRLGYFCICAEAWQCEQREMRNTKHADLWWATCWISANMVIHTRLIIHKDSSMTLTLLVKSESKRLALNQEHHCVTQP